MHYTLIKMKNDLYTSRKATYMNTESTTTHIFSRQPLSALGKVTAAALLGITVLCGIIWGFTGAHATGLLILTIILLLGTGLVASGIRWTPLLGTLLGGAVMIIFAGEPYVIYHLTQPKGLFVFFVIILLIFACAVVALGAGISATVQNYRRGERRAPRWLASALTGVAGVVIGAILIAAIAQPTVSTSSTTTNGVPAVHLGPSSFIQSSVTIAKGSQLLLVDDGSFLHILANGTWQNGQPVRSKEQNAPIVNNIQVSGGSVEIGPFTTAGTYHIYCTVHQGMNLEIIVQ